MGVDVSFISLLMVKKTRRKSTNVKIIKKGKKEGKDDKKRRE